MYCTQDATSQDYIIVGAKDSKYASFIAASMSGKLLEPRSLSISGSEMNVFLVRSKMGDVLNEHERKEGSMFPFWIIFGILMIFAGIFNRQMLQILGLKPLSEIFTVPTRKHSSRLIEKIAQGFVITLGAGFLVHGLGQIIPNDLSYKIFLALLGLAGLMVLAMIGITIVTWKVK